MRAVERFVEVVGDKPVNEISPDDAIDYCEWWRDRRLNLPDVFKGLRLKGETERPRAPYEADFIQNRLLADGALADLNEDARLVLYTVADTGLRPSEVVNLQESTIVLGAAIPYVKILPDGRRLKTGDSQREIPLVGTAVAAMKLRPIGSPRYRDKSSGALRFNDSFLFNTAQIRKSFQCALQPDAGFPMRMRNQEGQAGQECRQFRLTASPRLGEYRLRMRADRRDLDATIGGDFGNAPTICNSDGNFRLSWCYVKHPHQHIGWRRLADFWVESNKQQGRPVQCRSDAFLETNNANQKRCAGGAAYFEPHGKYVGAFG